MKIPIRKILNAFKQLNISIDEKSIICHLSSLPESMTNKFITATDVKGGCYLIRINGPQWPPFTRKHEAHNLELLKQKSIDTNVIYNDITNGFQICTIANSTKLTSELKEHSISPKEIGESLRKIHEVQGINNSYDLPLVTVNTFKQCGEAKQNIHKAYQIILSMVIVLQDNQENHTFSHNDILPSSICRWKEKVILVDWEYSAQNHRSFDLAFIIVKRAFNFKQEDQLLTSYDAENEFNNRYYVCLMKCVISFLFLGWQIKNNNQNLLMLTNDLMKHLKDAFIAQPFKKHIATDAERLQNVGIFWGTFDPATLAHKEVIEQAIIHLNLNRLIVVINDNNATGKLYKIPGRDRAIILRSLFVKSPIKQYVVIVRQTDVFTFSHNKIQEIYNCSRIHSIVGQDSFEQYGAKCTSYGSVFVVPRGNESKLIRKKITDLKLSNVQVLQIDEKFLHTSSTMVRKTIEQKEVTPLLPSIHPSTSLYIIKHGFLKTNYTAKHHSAAKLIQRQWLTKKAKIHFTKSHESKSASIKSAESHTNWSTTQRNTM